MDAERLCQDFQPMTPQSLEVFSALTVGELANIKPRSMRGGPPPWSILAWGRAYLPKHFAKPTSATAPIAVRK
jgi:hypothetical protein